MNMPRIKRAFDIDGHRLFGYKALSEYTGLSMYHTVMLVRKGVYKGFSISTPRGCVVRRDEYISNYCEEGE
jgi:hypothetical protein